MNTRDINQVIISVGSNIKPLPNIKESQKILARQTNFIYAADVIETDPVGYLNQANFLNTAFLVSTALIYEEFNASLKSIEDIMGRERGPNKAGPRTIDLDIITWNERLMTDDYYNFDYVSVPVNQVISAMGLSINISKNISSKKL
tara:strand:+ start:1101 stop:1538 length:438 start_codon:yes stop_codon:yes gene_type:complete